MALLLSQYEKGVSYLQKEIRRELLVAYQRYLNAQAHLRRVWHDINVVKYTIISDYAG